MLGPTLVAPRPGSRAAVERLVAEVAQLAGDMSHDIKNLFVVDGSSFVTGGSQNPTMTILSLSMRASEYLAEQMRKGEL